VAGVQKYVTSRTKNLSDEGIVNCIDNSFTDNLEAQSITTYITKNTVTGINTTRNSEIRIFPNPFKNEVTIKLSGFSPKAEITISTMLGQVVLRENVGSLEILKTGSSLSRGIYIVTISEGKKKMTYKIEKQE